MFIEVKALPLKLIPLDCQIRSAGGRGFNSSVVVRPVVNSFSVKYIFHTATGAKCLTTLNEVQLAMFNDSEYHFVYFNAEEGVYQLVTPEVSGEPPYKTLKIKSLGDDFDQMKSNLKRLHPTFVVEGIPHPDTLLSA
jgi:hypothetical protein